MNRTVRALAIKLRQLGHEPEAVQHDSLKVGGVWIATGKDLDADYHVSWTQPNVRFATSGEFVLRDRKGTLIPLVRRFPPPANRPRSRSTYLIGSPCFVGGARGSGIQRMQDLGLGEESTQDGGGSETQG